MKIDTDAKKIEEFLTRGVENIYPNIDFVRKQLLSGKKLTMYLGMDPTAPSLHIGNFVPIMKLREFQDLGHQVILLIGDFTATIGDPDKLSVRKPLTRSQVLDNCKTYKKQLSKLIRFGFTGAKLKYNSDWLRKMNFEDVLNLASKMTVDQMLKRDMFQERIKQGRPVYIHEFMYPLMQGYDSVVLKVDGEIGGNDQTFNMLTGRDLVKEMTGREKFVLTTKLLVDNGGVKMGKTMGNMASLSDSADDMFGKVMSWTDGMILGGFELSTFVSMSEIEKIKQGMLSGVNPRDIKVRLAKEIVTIYHSKAEADKAEENFVKTFKEGGLPEKIEEVKGVIGKLISETAVTAGAVSSKSEYRRLVEEGAVSDVISGEKITDPNAVIKNPTVYKIGKRRFFKVS